MPTKAQPVAILAGGVGTRLAEETTVRPKPMVEIGGRPILWHIMKHYSRYGFSEFFIALGYKGEYIKKHMVDYCHLNGNLTVHVGNGKNGNYVERHGQQHPDWTVHLIETGLHTMTGGRIKKLEPYLYPDGQRRGPFMLTWGDGVSDVDLDALLDFHHSHGKLATVTAVRPAARFGHMRFEGQRVAEFTEKPQTAEGWINGAFFVLEPEVFDYIDSEDTMWEREPMERLAAEGELMAYMHHQFWACMDTLRDKVRLQEMWDDGDAPWKTWAN